jgi:hypothetical protein
VSIAGLRRVARRFRRGLSLLPFLCGACQAGLALDDYSFGGAGGSESSSPNGQGGSSSGSGGGGSGGGAGSMAAAGAQSLPTAGSGGTGGAAGTGGVSGAAGASDGADAGASDAGGDPPDKPDPDQPTPCNPVANDCAFGQWCNAPDCSTIGVCATAPVASSPTMVPACGCNSTTYWNTTHAQWLGVTAFTTDYTGCGAAGAECNFDSDCAATGAVCITSHGLGLASCDNALSGRCWAIPSNATCDGAPTIDVGFGSCRLARPETCTSEALLYCPAVLEGDYFTICL